MSNENAHIRLSVAADPQLARLVRMTAANVATLCAMSVDRVEDVRMAAEEAFIFACAARPGGEVAFDFDVDPARVALAVELDGPQPDAEPGDESALYADLILGAVCDAYEKRPEPAALLLTLKADL